jgi:hypothetical protein
MDTCPHGIRHPHHCTECYDEYEDRVRARRAAGAVCACTTDFDHCPLHAEPMVSDGSAQ